MPSYGKRGKPQYQPSPRPASARVGVYVGLPRRRLKGRWSIQAVKGDLYIYSPEGTPLSGVELWNSGRGKWTVQAYMHDSLNPFYERVFSVRPQALQVLRELLVKNDAPPELLQRAR